MAASCDISQNDLVIVGDQATCGSPLSMVSEITVFGSTSTHWISVSNSSTITLEFSATTINATTPVRISDSNVTIVAARGAAFVASVGASPGIACESGARLAFESRDGGTLSVTGGSDGAGIGAPTNGRCASLRFVSGVYSVAAGRRGAGIGSGFGPSKVDSIVIEGGTFQVTAASGAAIGAGSAVGAESEVGALSIKGGRFESVVSQEGAGIGAGRAGPQGASRVRVVEIEEAVGVASSAAAGAGIGAGMGDGGRSSVERIVIGGGSEFIVSGESGAGIGAGLADVGGESAVDEITINGGRLEARSMQGAALGAGHADGGSSHVSVMVIRSGFIRCESLEGAGIGAGDAAEGSATVDSLLIENGTVYALSTAGAGIGAGSHDNGTATVGTLTIHGGSISARGPTAIGSTGSDLVEDITIGMDGSFLDLDLYSNSEFAISGGSVRLSSSSIVAFTNSRRYFDPSNRVDTAGVTFFGQYRGVSTFEAAIDHYALHFGQLPQFRGTPELRFRRTSGGFARTITFSEYPERGLIVTVPLPGEYDVDVTSERHHVLGYGGRPSFWVDPGDNFLDVVEICDTTSPTNVPGMPMATGTIVALAVGCLVLFGLICACSVLKKQHTRRPAPPQRSEPPAPEALMADGRRQGLLDEGELDDFPPAFAPDPEAPPQARDAPHPFAADAR
jgi:hypothetical protein